jgi:hypothetical protein
LAHQQMNVDYEKLKQDEADKSTKLQELMSVLQENDIKLKPITKIFPNITNNNPLDMTNEILANKKYNFTSANHTKSIVDYEDDDYPLIFTKNEKDLKNSKLHSFVKARKNNFNSLTSSSINTNNNNNKSLLSSILSSLSLACPTLHLHIILSLTMVLITHQCPQYLIVV